MMATRKIQLYHGNIYKYKKSANDFGYGVYMCDTNIKFKVCVIPADDKEDKKRSAYPINSLNKVAYPFEMIECNRDAIMNPLFIAGEVAKITYREYVYLSDVLIQKLTDKILDTYKDYQQDRYNSSKQNYIITEDYYKYLTWFEHKSNLEFNKNIRRNPIVKKYSIYFIEIGENIGSELHKRRPAVIYKRCTSRNPNDTSYIIFPITSKSSAARYAFNTPIIINGKTNYIKVNDIRRISLKRLKGPLIDKTTNQIVRLTNEEIIQLNKNFKEYFIPEE